MLDMIIRNGLIVDGTGNRVPFPGEVGIQDGQIVKLADHISGHAVQELDAKGHYIAPGFVDIHRHADARILSGDFGEVELRQGITTVVGGQCGLSIVPCPDEHKQEMFDFMRPIIGSVSEDCGFSSFQTYMDLVRHTGVILNYGSCVGNGACRMAANGFQHEISAGALHSAQDMLRASLEAGALGVTSGIQYAPECHYSRAEIVEVLRPMREYGVPLATHMRGEGDTLLSALAEVIDITRRLEVPLHVSHFKNVGRHNWGSNLDRAFELLYKARDEGMDVTWDAYPYTAGATQMIQFLPPEYLEGGVTEITERLKKPAERARIRAILSKHQTAFENQLMGCGWDGTIITAVTQKHNEAYLGMTVTELAKAQGKDPYDAAFDLMVDEQCAVGMVNFTASEAENRRIIQDGVTNIISDSLYIDKGLPHPRMYGSFPRVLETFVREEGLLSVEEAVMKMTSKCADVYGLTAKGRLAEGMDADIVVFDLDRIHTSATYTHPCSLPRGYDYVIVNGKIMVYADELVSEAKNGKVLIRGSHS